MQAYKNYIGAVLNRVNTYNGRVYKDDPAVFSWELANEAGSTADQTGETVCHMDLLVLINRHHALHC